MSIYPIVFYKKKHVYVHFFLNLLPYSQIYTNLIRFPVKRLEEDRMKKLLGFIKREEGSTAIEYGLIAALVGVAIVAALTTLGGTLSTTFGTITSKL